ncbi:hypothetical protein CDD80_2197 [Ophiocordyceps camponoti-rufipedis]|uniref:Uncharacterized protein n=1 Tax=Ophiocordyceps camponoti-rufipedis TaxID=2004952 RepID=A0A2C5YC79_9HYPO|nr:hypothetical protein CDD80_2197 [Ophiocordyceps camponoti-rufipedis]
MLRLRSRTAATVTRRASCSRRRQNDSHLKSTSSAESSYRRITDRSSDATSGSSALPAANRAESSASTSASAIVACLQVGSLMADFCVGTYLSLVRISSSHLTTNVKRHHPA